MTFIRTFLGLNHDIIVFVYGLVFFVWAGHCYPVTPLLAP